MYSNSGLWEQAAIGWDVGNEQLIYGSRPVPFPARSSALLASLPLFVRRGKPRLFGLLLLLKALYLPGYCFKQGLYYLITERAGLLLQRRLTAPYYLLLPRREPLLALPAGSGTFMSTYYSCGLNGVHNVEACFPRLCRGKLDLSNGCFPEKTLSLSKPPRAESSFAAFLTVLDGKEAPGKVTGGTLQGSVLPVP